MVSLRRHITRQVSVTKGANEGAGLGVREGRGAGAEGGGGHESCQRLIFPSVVSADR